MDSDEDTQACRRIYDEYRAISREEAEILGDETRLETALAVPEQNIRALERGAGNLRKIANKACPRLQTGVRTVPGRDRGRRGRRRGFGFPPNEVDNNVQVAMCEARKADAQEKLEGVERRLESLYTARNRASGRLAELERRRRTLRALRRTLDNQAATHGCDFSQGRSGR
ncbi:MAG: hypothetical protein AAF583_14500 [Pseudomonadota bacterium]